MKRLLTYLGVTFAITYACEFTLMAFYDRLVLIGASALIQIAVSFMMFVPLIGVVSTVLIFKDKFKDLPLRPHIKGNVRWYLAALFGPSVLTAAGAALYFVLNPGSFDPTMSSMTAALTQQSAAAGQAMDANMAALVMWLQILAAVVVAPFFNMIFAFGEETGWRGYMMPRLSERFGIKKAVLIGGVIWGVWHAPLTAMGHNYGTDYWGFPWLGIAAMCCFCIVMGCLLTWLTFKTGSVWPAALAHGALNAVAGAPVYFTAGEYSPFVGPMPTGFIGGAAFILVAAVAFFGMEKLGCPRLAGAAPELEKEDAQ